MTTIIQILPSLDTSGGGVERGTLDVARETVEKGYKSIIVSSGGNMSEKLKHKGVLHYEMPLNKKSLISYIKVKKKIRILIEEMKPDIVHVRSRWPAFCVNNIVKDLNIPLVTTYHGTYSGNKNFIKRKYNSLMTQGDRIISISEFITNHIKFFFPQCKNKIRLINRGIDTNYYDVKSVTQFRKEKLIKELGIDEKHHVILLPGRITQWKGHEVAIKSAEIISREKPELNFLMLFVGSEQNKNNYLKRLKSYVKNRGINNKILFAGNKNDMPSVYSISDLIISTSIEPEAFGRVSAEASAMSKPIIATNHGGSKNIIINNFTGWLIKENDPRILADSIIQVLNKKQNEKDIIGLNARKRIIEKFSLQQMLDKTLSLYQEIISEKKYINN